MAYSKKLMFLSEEWRAMLNQPDVRRRKRSKVEYFDCNCDESMKKKSKLFFGNCDEPKKKRSKAVEFFDGNCDEPKKKKKPKTKRTTNVRRATAVEVNENPPAEMPLAMREHIRQMGGYNLQLVIEKELTTTDMNTDQGRLALPPMQLRGDFLTEEEDVFLVKRENELNCMNVVIIGPDLTESKIRFKKWLIGTKFANCLMSQWNSFAKAHRLKARNNIQLWAFRVDRLDPATGTTKAELCFAFVKL